MDEDDFRALIAELEEQFRSIGAPDLARISHTPCGLRCSFGEADTASGGEKRIGAYG